MKGGKEIFGLKLDRNDDKSVILTVLLAFICDSRTFLLSSLRLLRKI